MGYMGLDIRRDWESGEGSVDEKEVWNDYE